MFVSLIQIKESLDALSTVHPFYGTAFLALKKVPLPVGEVVNDLNFTNVVNEILFRYYKPLINHDGFYSPFQTSNKSDRWQKNRYASTTLQRITGDTFGAAFIHPKNTQTWGWKENYLTTLKAHLPNEQKIPAFDLAVWLFRQEVWPDNVQSIDLINTLIETFNISTEERVNIFDVSIPKYSINWLQDEPVSDAEILNLIGYPTGTEVAGGAVLKSLELIEIGPATHFIYEPAKRLNIITGDNSLGKSFLFDCTWWALTNTWINDQPIPRSDTQLRTPSILAEIEISGKNTRTQKISANYSWLGQYWRTKNTKTIEAGLAVYARYDGSFVIWDSTLNDFKNKEVKDNENSRPKFLNLSREQLWNGLVSTDKKTSLCNGIIRDLVSWQLSGSRYEHEWNALKACLKTLSPSNEPLSAGQPIRIDVEDQREIPTIVMPYGPVALTHASAGIQRIIALAYTLVWTWFRHTSNAEILRQEPQRNFVLIVDEVEAHLHPRWQKTIVPALMNAVENLSAFISPQIHLATHSPLVMASAEEVFDEDKDNFHHLRLINREVVLEVVSFQKQGTADNWLMSEAFDQTVPRSSNAENAIQDALDLQLAEKVSKSQVKDVNDRLIVHLDDLDDFWPRWTYFAKQHGIK